MASLNNTLTQAQLKQQLHYDPETGLFTRLVSNVGSVKVGDIAGCKDISKGYIRIRINKIKYAAHRLAVLYMTGSFPEFEVDHKNHIKDDNKWLNLKPATHQENGKNQKICKNNTSGISGVNWNNQQNKWVARIGLSINRIYLGAYSDYFEACCARKSAENKYDYHENNGR